MFENFGLRIAGEGRKRSSSQSRGGVCDFGGLCGRREEIALRRDGMHDRVSKFRMKITLLIHHLDYHLETGKGNRLETVRGLLHVCD